MIGSPFRIRELIIYGSEKARGIMTRAGAIRHGDGQHFRGVSTSVGTDRSDTASDSPDIEAWTGGAELQPSPFIYRCKGNDDETHDTIINEWRWGKLANEPKLGLRQPTTTAKILSFIRKHYRVYTQSFVVPKIRYQSPTSEMRHPEEDWNLFRFQSRTHARVLTID